MGPNRFRTRIGYSIGPDCVVEILKYVRLNWKRHCLLRSLARAADLAPMIMQVKVPISGQTPINNAIKWDWGLLAAGVHAGRQREGFVADVAMHVERYKEAFQ